MIILLLICYDGYIILFIQQRDNHQLINMSSESIQKVSNYYFNHLFIINDYIYFFNYLLLFCYDGYITLFTQQRDRDLVINMSSSSIQKVSNKYFIQLFIIDDYFIINVL